MTKVNKKLEEMHVNLWGLHYSPSLLKNTYAKILIYAKIKKL